MTKPAAPVPQLANLEVACSECVAARRVVGPLPLAGTTEAMQYDAAEGVVRRLGWSVRRNANNKREFVCPDCTAKLRAAFERALPAFSDAKACPKCGWPEVGVGYSDGLGPECPRCPNREHVHKICRRCSYRWQEECRDAAPAPETPKRRGWLRRMFGGKGT